MKNDVRPLLRDGAVVCYPAAPERWPDVARLFGERGACGGCWCMAWRLSRSAFVAGKGAKNKAALRSLIRKGAAPGVLAYVGSEPVGWCAVAPREQYPALARSRVLAPVDTVPVWSISCFFIAKGSRGKGVSVALLKAAVEHAHRNGAKIVEGYPNDIDQPLPAAFVWTGLLGTFAKAGFGVLERRSPKRPIVRLPLDDQAT